MTKDFTVAVDRFQLDGTARDYYTSKSSITGVGGTALSTERGNIDELIAIIRNPTVLTAANTITTALDV